VQILIRISKKFSCRNYFWIVRWSAFEFSEVIDIELFDAKNLALAGLRFNDFDED